jgi:hypothetical protein
MDGPDPETKAEAPGTGVNEFVYFVANSVLGPWEKLPWCTPAMIQTSRNMRRYLTGDIKAPVLGFPRFPWGEGAYLRALIARITFATHICPKGLYEAGEDDESNVLTKVEVFTPPSSQDMALFENWVHFRGFLFNKEGRVTPFVAEEDGGDDDTEVKRKVPEEEKEDPIKILTQIDEDKSPIGSKVWSVRAAPSLSSPHAVVSMYNFHWPGAVSVYSKGEFANIYVGFGHKFLPGPFTPPPPPTPAMECDLEALKEGKNDPNMELIDPPQQVKGEKSEEKEEDAEEEDD